VVEACGGSARSRRRTTARKGAAHLEAPMAVPRTQGGRHGGGLPSMREEQRWRPKMEAGQRTPPTEDETGSRGVVRVVDDDDTTRGHSFFSDSVRSYKNSGVR
jgi:hypothetical protein